MALYMYWNTMVLTGINLINMRALLLLIAIIFTNEICLGQTIKPEGSIVLTSSTSTTLSAGVSTVNINPVSALATLTVGLPTNPNDRDVVVFQFGGTITSGTVVTLFSTASSIGILPSQVPILVSSGTCIMYIYNVTTNKWYRFL